MYPTGLNPGKKNEKKAELSVRVTQVQWTKAHKYVVHVSCLGRGRGSGVSCWLMYGPTLTIYSIQHRSACQVYTIYHDHDNSYPSHVWTYSDYI